jgi:hypothetical protein
MTIKLIKTKTTLVALHLLAFCFTANAADPISAITTLNNALHATSLASMLAKVSGNNTDLTKNCAAHNSGERLWRLPIE